MPLTTDEALRDIEAALTNQNHRFAAFVDAFSDLPGDTRIDVDAALLDAIEATTSTPTTPTNSRPVSIGLRA
jgi:hypothetical protein